MAVPTHRNVEHGVRGALLASCGPAGLWYRRGSRGRAALSSGGWVACAPRCARQRRLGPLCRPAITGACIAARTTRLSGVCCPERWREPQTQLPGACAGPPAAGWSCSAVVGTREWVLAPQGRESASTSGGSCAAAGIGRAAPAKPAGKCCGPTHGGGTDCDSAPPLAPPPTRPGAGCHGFILCKATCCGIARLQS